MLLAFDQLLLAGAVFVGGHVLISSTQLRGQLRGGLGEAGYLALYSALALVSFAWFVFAFLHAPHLVIWQPPVRPRWIPLLVVRARARSAAFRSRAVAVRRPAAGAPAFGGCRRPHEVAIVRRGCSPARPMCRP